MYPQSITLTYFNYPKAKGYDYLSDDMKLVVHKKYSENVERNNSIIHVLIDKFCSIYAIMSMGHLRPWICI